MFARPKYTAEKLSKIATQSETSSLDPLLNTFMTAHSMGDLVKRLQTIFRRLDTDNSGGLSHQVHLIDR